ncbi:MAG: CapA family protein [Candidatus Berkiella sp.]
MQKRLRCLITVALLIFGQPIAQAQKNNLKFHHACDKGQQVTIAAMGDLLFHRPLQEKASKQGYDSLWKEAQPFLNAADIVYANLEGPIAPGINASLQEGSDPNRFDYTVYTDFPAFNYHPRLAQDLKKSGFTLVSTANNHTLDRRAIGVNKTIAQLENHGILHVGSRKSGSQSPFFTITQKNGLKIAWIACTEHTNGFDDNEHQIRYCYKEQDKKWILDKIKALKSSVDAIIITPHWGTEYQEKANSTQRAFAHLLLEAGADAVIGSHPHVLQEVEQYTTKDNRQTLISYSLGNFVSFQGSTRTRSTIILLLGLTKTASGTYINGVRFVPMVMLNRNGTQQIHLSKLNPDETHLSAFGYISRAIPKEYALFNLPIVTNPGCSGR